MKKLLFTFAVLLCHTAIQAQVDNYCLQFSPNGSVNCGPMPELDNKDKFSVQFWMNADTWIDGATILSRGNGFAIKTTTAKTLNIAVGEKSFNVTHDDLAVKKWVQVTLNSNGSDTKVLINGNVAATVDGNCKIPVDGTPFTLGGGTFAGRIDELRVWNAELAADYDYFIHNTLNKWAPQLDDLVAYYKFDQNLCQDVVDYKALFAPGRNNHHGKMSSQGVERQIVTDNAGLPYLLCGAYSNHQRFFDRALTRDQFLLANDIILLSINSKPDGHLEFGSPNDHATLVNAEHLAAFKGRDGVLSLKGNGSKMTCTTTTLSNNTELTFETWIHLDKWTEGAYIFRKESADKQQGFSISLGEEATKQIVVCVNGKKFVNQNAMRVGEWMYFAVTTFKGGTPANTFLFKFNDIDAWADESLSDNSTDYAPTGMGAIIAEIGAGLTAKLDQTAVFNRSFTSQELAEHKENLPMPGLGKSVNAQLMLKSAANYAYDKADFPGYDAYSQDEWKAIMESAYKGYRGYQFRISVAKHDTWLETIKDANKRKIFAEDLARLSEGYDGVELDLEWMDGVQTNLGLLGDEIKKVLPAGKTFMVSCHAYGAYKYPPAKIKDVDGFTFQQYGPQKTYFNYNSFTASYNNFVQYGFPKNKIYLSYSTTTTRPYNANDVLQNGGVSGIRNGFIDDPYVPNENGQFEKGLLGGNYYYFMGPVQVYKRAKFCVDNKVKGIFYWDMGNDVPVTHPYNLAKHCNYALASNVDTLVTEVEVKHVSTLIQDIHHAQLQDKVDIRLDAKNQMLHAIVPEEIQFLGMEIYTGTAAKVYSDNSTKTSVAAFLPGVYLVKIRLGGGTVVCKKFLKH